jgi:hypothetical protein
MKTILALLATATLAPAANYVGNQTFSAPFSLTDSVNIVGDLTLATPGSYSVTSWNVVGTASGAVALTVNYRTSFSFAGTVASSMTVIDGPNQPPAPTPPVARENPPLVNMSVRATLAIGQSITPAFVVGGTTSQRVLIRAIGPGLAPSGVTSPVLSPTKAVYSGQSLRSQHSLWDSSLSAVFSSVGAFSLTAGSRDAAALLTLSPGAYTVQASGGAGELLLEVYFVD